MVQDAGPHIARSNFQAQRADAIQNLTLTPLGSALCQRTGRGWEGEVTCSPATADARSNLGCGPTAVKLAKQPATSTAVEPPREKAPSSQMLFLEKNCCGTWPQNGASVQLISAWS